jgi:hypothetical protein
MNNRNLIRGIFLMAVSLVFGLGSFRYSIGALGHAGPGLFPLLVSSVLFIMGLATAVRAFFVDPIRIPMQFRSVTIVLVSLIGYAFISTYAGMLVGTVFMTFCSGFGGVFSWKRSTIISVGLILIALALQYGLGLNMPLMPPQF